ncbi:MAG: hypothetical protein U0324_46960 [Polyangiales bacterium]
MSLRDDLLPVLNELRGLADEFGLRTIAVTVRERVYSLPPGTVGATVTATNDTALTPAPAVRPAREHRADEAIVDGPYADATAQPRTLRYEVGPITPAHVGGGYSAAQLMPGDSETRRVTLVLSGGQHGEGEEYRVVRLDDSKPFRIMLVVERARQGA